MTFLKYAKLNSHRILVWLTEHINIVLFCLHGISMRICDIYFIIVSRKYYFATEGKKCFWFVCFFTRQAGKNDIAFCVIKKKKKENTGPKDHTAGLFNFLNYWIGLTAWSKSIDRAEINGWEGQIFSPGWPLSYASEYVTFIHAPSNFKINYFLNAQVINFNGWYLSKKFLINK